MAETVKVEFKNKRGRKLVGILDLPEGKRPPVVVVLHSFTGYKELKPLHAIAQKAVEEGLAALRFDFSDCIGESQGTCEEMRLSSQVEDVLAALEFVEGLEQVDGKRVGLCGHSLGGTTAVNAAMRYGKAKALVTIAALAKPDWEHLFPDEKVREWKKKGWTEFDSYRRGKVRINYGFYEDLIAHRCGENISMAGCPVRVLHGTKDKVLDLMNAAYLFDHAKEPKDIKLLDGADHMFLKDPYKGEMAELVVGWMKQHLKQG